jgi:hypothetical protein
MLTTRRAAIALIGLSFATALCPLSAQDTRGAILGRITDQSGAMVAGAEVRATHAATGVVSVAKSNQAGNFTLPYLAAGAYTLQAEFSGFKKYVRSGIEVRISDSIEVNIEMQVGNASEAIDVTAETPLLNSVESSIGQVVDERRITELPLFGGSAISLVLLAPGTVNGTDMRQADRASTVVASQISTNGAGLYKNEFTIDGVANTIPDTANNGNTARVAFIPPQLALGEFKVQTASYDASVGHTSGSVMNVSTKSGSNQFKGAIQWVVRNRIFDAPKIFQNRSGQEIPVYQSNRYGIGIGGPLAIPRVYDGKSRTFWFYAYEGMRHGIPQTWIGSVPTEPMRRGDLSSLLKISGNYQMYDPFTAESAPGGHTRRQPIPNNVIPASRLDPVAQNLLKFWPLPNQPGTADARNNWYYSEPTRTETWVHLARVDHAFTENHRAFVRVDRDSWGSMEGRMFGNIARGTQQTRKNSGVALDDVYVINPSFLVNFRYGFTYQEWTEYRLSRGIDLTSLGFSKGLTSLLEPSLVTLPQISIGSFTPIGSWAGGDGTGTAMIHAFAGNLTRYQGNHALRFGVDFRVARRNRNVYPYRAAPAFSFSNSYTRGPLDNSPAPSIGAELASMLMGIPGGQMQQPASSAEQDLYLGLYLQDDLKLTPRLTLNVGLRYEYDWPMTERFDRSVASFAFKTPNPVEAQARANYALSPIPELAPANYHAMGGLTFVNSGGLPRSYWSADKLMFMPRIGLAYQLNRRTVLRTGYGMFYDSTGVHATAANQIGFSQSTQIQLTRDEGLSFLIKLADPFPNGILQPLGASGGMRTNLGQAITFFPEHRKHGYAQRWSLGLQRQLPGQFMAEAAYVGNRGTRLGVTRNLNNTPAQYLSTSGVRDQKTIDFLAYIFPEPLSGTDPVFGRSVTRGNLLRPYPQFGAMSVIDPAGYSWYHSLQVRSEKRFAAGYTGQLSYTWSKTMAATEFLNPTDPLPYRSLMDMDRTHRIVVSGIMELPFGRGRKFGSTAPKPLLAVAGGWQLSGMMQRQSGPPLGFGDAFTLFTGNPDNIALPKDVRNVDRWFNTNAGFNRNSAQQLANNIRVSPLRFGGLRGDGQARWDFSAIKNFKIAEKMRFQLRAECLNAWNHPNLFTPDTNPISSTFGTITGQDVPRIWQMSLKLTF